MIIPVRCFSCGKPIAHLWEDYNERLQNNEESNKVLNSIGLKRYCCRQMFLGQVDLIDVTSQFKKN